MWKISENRSSGPSLAVLSAALFGISPVFAKSVLGEVSPILLAGLLYLGSGFTLFAPAFGTKESPFKKLQSLTTSHKLKLLGAIRP